MTYFRWGGQIYNFTFWCNVSSALRLPKIIEIGPRLTELLYKKTKRWQFFWGTQCMFWYRGVASKSRVAEKGAAELWLSSASKWCDDDDDDDDEVEQLSVTRIIIGTQRVIQKRHSSDPVYVRQLRLKVGLWKASVHTTVTDLKISLECISIATTD